MPALPKLHWYDNPILLWIAELIALGVVLGATGRERSLVFDAVVIVASLIAFGALNLAIARRGARRV